MAPILALAIGLLLAFRQWQFLMAAEQGRKQDLIKRLYRVQDGFRMLVLVPCLTHADLEELPYLLKNLAQQDYPKANMGLHLVTVPALEETAHQLLEQCLDAQEITERISIKLWTFPGGDQSNGFALSVPSLWPFAKLYKRSSAWLIDRCLTLGSGAVFVFLNPTDHLKNDFLQNVAAKTFEYPVLQGYLALRGSRAGRQRQAGILDYCVGRVQALYNRLMNRVGNAGRFHAGLSAVLQSSGFAIKQDVLERISPGALFSPRQYTLQLALKNVKIAWAPHVVVYRKNQFSGSQYLAECLDNTWERLQLLQKFGLLLLSQGLLRFNNTLIDLAVDLLQPPATVVLLGCAWGVMSNQGAFSGVLTLLALGILLFQGLGLCVARGKFQDFITLSGFTPLVSIYVAFGLPAIFLQRGFQLANQNNAQDHPVEKGTVEKGTMEEDTEVSNPASIVAKAFPWEVEEAPLVISTDPTSSAVSMIDPLVTAARHGMQTLSVQKAYGQTASAAFSEKRIALPLASPALGTEPNTLQNSLDSTRHEPSLHTTPKPLSIQVALSNGSKQVSCQLNATPELNLDVAALNPSDPASGWQYRMNLAYKSVSFSTAAYSGLDEAFEALQKKLGVRGLHIVSCGSCGYFYAPAFSLSGDGYCLFAKRGQALDPSTDTITVLSQCCNAYTDIKQRDQLLQQWQQSTSTAVYSYS